MGECCEGDGDEAQLGQRCGRGHAHDRCIATLCTVKRHGELEERHGQRQDQGEMSGLGNHGLHPPCQTPFSLSLSATSLGM